MQAGEQLRSEGIAYQESTPLGIMVEVPAAALCIEDFFYPRPGFCQ